MIVSLVILLLSALWSQAACLPDSINLRENLLGPETRVMEQTVQRFEAIMGREIPAGHHLVVRLDSLNPRVNAEVIQDSGTVTISVWGGMLSHPRMAQGALLLLLCHEVGHFLGGPPLKSRTGWSSTEGQADYFSTEYCVKDLGLSEREFLEAATALTAIYAEVSGQVSPRFDRCDESIATRTNYGYPSVQCRLDTLTAGWRRSPRPSCWFVD